MPGRAALQAGTLALGGALCQSLPHQGVWLLILGLPLLAAPLAILLAARTALRQEARVMRLAPASVLRGLLGGPWLRLIMAAAVALAVSCVALIRLAGQPNLALAALAYGGVGYAAAHLILARLIGRELDPVYRSVVLALWSAMLGTVLALGASWALLAVWQPQAVTVPPGPSALVAEALRWQALGLRVERGLEAGLAAAEGQRGVASVVWAVLTQGAGFAWVCGTLAALSLPWAEVARAWRPAGRAPQPQGAAGLAWLAATWTMLILFLWVPVVLRLEGWVAAREPAHLTAERLVGVPAAGTLAPRPPGDLPSLIAEQVVQEVERIGGDLFTPGTIARIEALPRPAELPAAAHADLLAAIDRGFDAMVANVDHFLDSYYSLPNEYMRLAALAAGTLEAQLEAALREALARGDPFAGIEAAARRLEAASAAETAYRGTLEAILEGARAELRVGVEPRVVAERASVGLPAGVDFARLLDDTRRRGVLAAGGATGAATVVAGLVVRRAVARGALRVAAQQVLKVVAARTAGSGSGAAAGAGIGAWLGSVVPGVGTALGAIAGGIIGGLAAGVSVDALMLALDEAMNRAEFRAEIVDAIEAQRAETIAALSPPPP